MSLHWTRTHSVFPASYHDDPVDELDDILCELGEPRLSEAERVVARMLIEGHRVDITERGGRVEVDVLVA